MADSYDVIVIGGGPAGYPAAIRAAQNKLSVACIDGWKNRDGSMAFGGTCLNAGCIPSKALLESSELLHRAQHEFAAHGVKLDGIGFDVAQMQKRKGAIVKGMTGGILALFKAAGVVPLAGHGRLLPGRKVRVHGRRRRQAHAAGQARGTRLGVGADATARPRVRRQGDCGFLGRSRFRVGAEAAVRYRRGRHRARARQRLAPPGRRDGSARGARAVPADGGRRGREGSAAAFQEAGTRHPPRRQGVRREGRQGRRRGPLRRQVGRADAGGGPRRGRDRPSALHEGPAGRGRRRRARCARLHPGGRPLPHRRRKRLGDRRLRAGTDARAQGQGGGRRGRRPHRRPVRSRELQRHPVGDLHRARDRLGRASPRSRRRRPGAR